MKSIQNYDFYSNLLAAENALSNGDIEEMDRKLIEFKSLFFNSSDFTLNMKRDIWKEKYLLYAKRAKKIESNYELKQYFFDKNENIITIIDSIQNKNTEAVLAEIDKQAIKSVLQNYFKYEKGMTDVPNSIDELELLYENSLESDKENIEKLLDNDFQIDIQNHQLKDFINKSDETIKSSFVPNQVNFDNLIKEYNLEIPPNKLEEIKKKLENNNFR